MNAVVRVMSILKLTLKCFSASNAYDLYVIQVRRLAV
jgi:hypothetical protein